MISNRDRLRRTRDGRYEKSPDLGRNTWISDTTGGWVAEFTLSPLVSLQEMAGGRMVSPENGYFHS